MLYYYIISIEPATDEDGQDYQSAAYYAGQVENGEFHYERPYRDFTTLSDFKYDTFEYAIDSREPRALLTISYDQNINEYKATDLYIINSPHAEKEHQFASLVILTDVGLADEDDDLSESMDFLLLDAPYFAEEDNNQNPSSTLPNEANVTDRPEVDEDEGYANSRFGI